MEEKYKKGFVGLLIFVFSLPVTLLDGYVLLQVYNFFLLEIFKYPATYIQMVGLNLFVNLVIYKYDTKELTAEDMLKMFFGRIFGILFVWGYAYVIYLIFI